VVQVNLSPDEFWRELDREEKLPGSRPRKSPIKPPTQVGHYFKGEVDTEKLDRRRRDRKVAYLRKRSTTDPEATIHYRPGIGASLSYKAHFATDASGIITAVSISSS